MGCLLNLILWPSLSLLRCQNMKYFCIYLFLFNFFERMSSFPHRLCRYFLETKINKFCYFKCLINNSMYFTMNCLLKLLVFENVNWEERSVIRCLFHKHKWYEFESPVSTLKTGNLIMFLWPLPYVENMAAHCPAILAKLLSSKFHERSCSKEYIEGVTEENVQLQDLRWASTLTYI